MTSVDAPAFGAWSLLSLTTTAHGAPIYPDELGSTYVYDTTVPNGRYIVPGDLAVIRDNRTVFGAGWIDNIETAPGRKIRFRCPNPNCRSTDFKHRSTRQFAYRCAVCTAEFEVPAEEELTVQVFTANYSRTWRLSDRPFPEETLDSAYIAKAQQHAIRRLDVAPLRPIIEAHLVTGEPWWGTQVREEERIPGATVSGWPRLGSASSDSVRPCSAGMERSAPSPARSRPERWKQHIFTSIAKTRSMTSMEACCFDAICMHCLIAG